MSEATSRNLRAPKQNSATRILDHLALHTEAPDDAIAECRLGDLRALIAASETSTREQILDEAVRRIEQSRDARFHEEGGSLTQDTNEPTGASHISDWIEGMDDAVEVVRTFKERR